MRIRAIIPNFLTLCNLLMGCFSVLLALSGDYFFPTSRALTLAAWAIVVGGICDLLDGFTARLLKGESALGMQLDSLADLVTFGLAPASLYAAALMRFDLFSAPPHFLLVASVYLLALATALRLAIFNTDDSQTHLFRGIPSPASALFTAGLFLGLHYGGFQSLFASMLGCPYAVFTWVILQSALMLLPIPMLSFKVKGRTLGAWLPQLILAVGAIVLLAVMGPGGLAFAVALYLLLSLLFQRRLWAELKGDKPMHG